MLYNLKTYSLINHFPSFTHSLTHSCLVLFSIFELTGNHNIIDTVHATLALHDAHTRACKWDKCDFEFSSVSVFSFILLLFFFCRHSFYLTHVLDCWLKRWTIMWSVRGKNESYRPKYRRTFCTGGVVAVSQDDNSEIPHVNILNGAFGQRRRERSSNPNFPIILFNHQIFVISSL